MTKRGRPLKGQAPATSTERARTARRRAAAKARAFEVFASVIRMEVDHVQARKGELTDRKARLVAGRAIYNLIWLDDRLADLDAAADLFGLDANGKMTGG